MPNKPQFKTDWAKVQDWMNENKKLLIMACSYEDDAISISFNGLNSFVRFPPGKTEDGIIYNALQKSKFSEAISPLMSGIIKATGIKEKDKNGKQILHVLGGAVQSTGKVEQDKLKTNNAKA